MPKRQANKPTQKVKTPRGTSAKPNGKALAAKGAGRAKPAGAARKKTAAARKKKAAPVPERYGTATPHLIVSPCTEAIEFYAKAFGAKLLMKMPGPGGLIMHAEIKIGDSVVMLSDEMDMPGAPNTRRSPKNVGVTTGGVMLYLKNVDAFFERAVSAGATAVMAPADQFWGDRYGQIEDPFGHVWALATHLQDLTPKEMQKAFAQMGASEA
jgi:PhnB protein